MKTKNSIKLAARGILNAVMPPLCTLCGTNVDFNGRGCCRGCESEIARISGNSCVMCSVPFGLNSEGDDRRLCGDCIKEEKHFAASRSSVIYSDAVRESIQRFKYSRGFSEGKLMSFLIREKAADFSREVGVSFDIIVGVPLHRRRLKERGYNQSSILASYVSRETGAALDLTALVRQRDTTPQVGLKPKDRLLNVKGAFAVTDEGVFKEKNVLLIDDVYTTGATINECSKVLKNTGAKVWALTVARAAGEGFDYV